MDDAASYAPAWRDLRRRNLLFWLSVAAVPLAVAAVDHVFAPSEFIVLILTAIPFLVLVTATGAYKASFRCPRCNNTFFEKEFWQNTFSRKCMHCGLPRGAEPEKSRE